MWERRDAMATDARWWTRRRRRWAWAGGSLARRATTTRGSPHLGFSQGAGNPSTEASEASTSASCSLSRTWDAPFNGPHNIPLQMSLPRALIITHHSHFLLLLLLLLDHRLYWNDPWACEWWWYLQAGHSVTEVGFFSSFFFFLRARALWKEVGVLCGDSVCCRCCCYDAARVWFGWWWEMVICGVVGDGGLWGGGYRGVGFGLGEREREGFLMSSGVIWANVGRNWWQEGENCERWRFGRRGAQWRRKAVSEQLGRLVCRSFPRWPSLFATRRSSLRSVSASVRGIPWICVPWLLSTFLKTRSRSYLVICWFFEENPKMLGVVLLR